MRVLVTGATGFLGGALVRRLKRDGYAPLALGRNVVAGADLAEAGIPFYAADLADGAALDRLPLQKVDAVVHAAALSSAWGPMADFVRANVEGTQGALRLARRLEAKRLVHISSPSVYFRFADQLDVPETLPLPPPVNAYARTKGQSEGLALGAADLGPIVLRPRGIYGAGDVALLPRLLHAARQGPLPLLREGTAVTDLTHVDDVVAAVMAALAARREAEGRIFNISGGQALPVRLVAEKSAARAGVALRWRPLPVGLALAAARLAELAALFRPGRPEPRVTAYGLGILAFSQTLDISAARATLGWVPSVGFDEGLGRTFAARGG